MAPREPPSRPAARSFVVLAAVIAAAILAFSPATDARCTNTRFGKKCGRTLFGPHAHDTPISFEGLPDRTFCLLTDRDLHVNMRLRGYAIGAPSVIRTGKAVRTWVRELGFLWKDRETGATHRFRIAARDGKTMERGEGGSFLKEIEFDGRALPLMEPGASYDLPGGLSFTLVAHEQEGAGGFFDVDRYSLAIDGYVAMEMKLRAAHPLLQTPGDAQVHMSIHFTDAPRRSPDVHGILGQSYRAGQKRRPVDYSSLSMLLYPPFAGLEEGGASARDGGRGDGVSARKDDGEEPAGQFFDGQARDYATSGVLATDCLYTAFGGRALPLPEGAKGDLIGQVASALGLVKAWRRVTVS
eukprot:TRINITY_DN1731_c0_g1_i1.p1 TRINITY_DN1731_c0_g1~~TRINITY_DN1731_c0_g1_i1.p1  ORF type:complete len:355 (+),score=-24.65 TRINITY_DN1731_c0_g1_i1:447-1511(+)